MPPGTKINTESAPLATTLLISAWKSRVPQFEQDLADDLAVLVGALEAVQHVLPGLIVRRHHEHLLQPFEVHELAHRFGGLVVLERTRDEVGAAILARHAGPAGVGAHHDPPAAGYRALHGGQNVRPDNASHDVDPIGLEPFAHGAQPDVRFALVVGDKNVRRHTAQLVAIFLPAFQIEAELSSPASWDLPSTAAPPESVLRKPMRKFSACAGAARPAKRTTAAAVPMTIFFMTSLPMVLSICFD